MDEGSSTLRLLFRLKKRCGWRRRRRWVVSWGMFVVGGELYVEDIVLSLVAVEGEIVLQLE